MSVSMLEKRNGSNPCVDIPGSDTSCVCPAKSTPKAAPGLSSHSNFQMLPPSYLLLRPLLLAKMKLRNTKQPLPQPLVIDSGGGGRTLRVGVAWRAANGTNGAWCGARGQPWRPHEGGCVYYNFVRAVGQVS